VITRNRAAGHGTRGADRARISAGAANLEPETASHSTRARGASINHRGGGLDQRGSRLQRAASHTFAGVSPLDVREADGAIAAANTVGATRPGPGVVIASNRPAWTR
jgi:hypothetical protein